MFELFTSSEKLYQKAKKLYDQKKYEKMMKPLVVASNLRKYPDAQLLFGIAIFNGQGIGEKNDHLENVQASEKFFRWAAQQGNEEAKIWLDKVAKELEPMRQKQREQAELDRQRFAEEARQRKEWEQKLCDAAKKANDEFYKPQPDTAKAYLYALTYDKTRLEYIDNGWVFRMAEVSEGRSVAFQLYEYLAQNNYPDGICCVGRCYSRGEAVEKDYAKAIQYYKDARWAGSALAAYEFGVLYERGEGVPQSWETAIELYEEACAKRIRPAMARMADLYLEGKYVSCDLGKAIELLEEVADSENDHNLIRVAQYYRTGLGEDVQKNLVKAARYAKDAVEYNLDGARELYYEIVIEQLQELLAEHASNKDSKEGIEKKILNTGIRLYDEDFLPEALPYLKEAAGFGYIKPFLLLASLYKQGVETGTPDIPKAKFWFQRWLSEMKPGDVITLGRNPIRNGSRYRYLTYTKDIPKEDLDAPIQWRVLHVEEDRALLLSEAGLRFTKGKPDEKVKSATFSDAFSPQEKSLVWGDPFDLSIEQADKYVGRELALATLAALIWLMDSNHVPLSYDFASHKIKFSYEEEEKDNRYIQEAQKDLHCWLLQDNGEYYIMDTSQIEKFWNQNELVMIRPAIYLKID